MIFQKTSKYAHFLAKIRTKIVELFKKHSQNYL